MCFFKKYLLKSRIVILLVCLFLVDFAFTQTFEWLITGGGPLSDKATGIVIDTNGNTFITGFFNEEATFGPFYEPLIDAQSKEVFVAKIDPNGNYLWAKRGSNHYDDRGLGICLDPMGNVYVTGTCWGGLIFGPLNEYNSSFYTDQIFVLKLDTDGNEVWLKNAGVDESGYPYNDDHGYDLVSDSNGDILITGFISNNDPDEHFANFDAIQIPVPAFDSLAFVAKLSNSGVWQWVRTNGGVDGYRDNRITVDDENNVYVTGGFQGTKTFETTVLTSFGLSDIYVTKYANTGDFIYAKNAGSPYDDRGNDIAFDHQGHLYITGEFKGVALFDAESVNNYGSDEDRDIFVARMSKNGEWSWVKKAGSNGGGDRGNGIVVNNSGNIFVTGQFKGKAKFGSSWDLDAGTDSIQVFIAAIDSLGKWRWALQGGGPDSDRGNGITCDDDCNVYVDGYYANTIFFDTITITSTGKKDMFILKISDACFGYDTPPDTTTTTTTTVIDDFSSLNVFTPNDDGVNDELTFFKNSNAVGTIKIVNRWGNVVYESTDLNKSWNGKDLGNTALSDGVYFYIIEYTLPGAELKKHQGFVTLTR